jgi:hypothetical protein
MMQEVETFVPVESVKYTVLGSMVQALSIHEFREGRGVYERLHS